MLPDSSSYQTAPLPFYASVAVLVQACLVEASWVQSWRDQHMDSHLIFVILWSASCVVFGFVAGRGCCCCGRVRGASPGSPSKGRAEEEQALSELPRAVLRTQAGRHVEFVFHTNAERTMVHASADCPRLRSASKTVVRREVCSDCFPGKRRL